MAQADAERVPPAWLRPLLETKYFEVCPDHPLGASRGTRSGGTCNFFCTDCPGRALCTSCLAGHPGHKVIQIRKLFGHGVVRVADVEALLNVSEMQPYLLNCHHVVFLNKRPMAGQGRTGEIMCAECERAILDAACRFCSIGCKLAALPDDLDFTVSFAVAPKSDSESLGGNDSDSSTDDHTFRPSGSRSAKLGRGNSAQEGEAGTSGASKLSSQHRRSKGVPENF
ncbi:uncharacterized protein LOC112885190 [Panicum hallii]|nr:uncharacterized protein LOC112885190 [Panicum hallii]